jgi:hypothetical protein
MSNVLADDKHHQTVALGRLGWSLRGNREGDGVRRKTISGYLKAVASGCVDADVTSNQKQNRPFPRGGVHRLSADSPADFFRPTWP